MERNKLTYGRRGDHKFKIKIRPTPRKIKIHKRFSKKKLLQQLFKENFFRNNKKML